MPAMRINKEESSMGYIFFGIFCVKTEGILNETETNKPKLQNNKMLSERAIRRRSCDINCECEGIVRNDIFPDTFRTNTLTFLL